MGESWLQVLPVLVDRVRVITPSVDLLAWARPHPLFQVLPVLVDRARAITPLVLRPAWAELHRYLVPLGRIQDRCRSSARLVRLDRAALVLGQRVLAQDLQVLGQQVLVVRARGALQAVVDQGVVAAEPDMQVAERRVHPVLPAVLQRAAVALQVVAQAAVLQQVLSASPVVGRRVVASPSGQSVKNSTIWRPRHLQACGCSAVRAKRFDCHAVRA